MNNKTVYAIHDFDQWVHRQGLIPEENYFLSKYLSNKQANTLEAGTGGGRISFALEEEGYSTLTAFDFVEPFIEAAKLKNQASKINFCVADAVNLSEFPDNTFEQAIYLQQIISLIPFDLIDTALLEAARVLKPGSPIIFSFLNWNGRSYNMPLSLLTNCLRKLRSEPVSQQQLPWLKLGGKFNWKFLFSNQSTTYWFTKEEIKATLERLGFTILEIKTASEITGVTSEGMLYVACTKRAFSAS